MASDLRDRTSDKERLEVLAHYHTDISRNLQDAMKANQLGSSPYPRDWGSLNTFAYLCDLEGKLDRALEYARMVLQMTPNNTLCVASLAQPYLEQGDPGPFVALSVRF